MELQATEGVPVDVSTGLVELVQLQASIDLGGHSIDLKVVEKTVRVVLRPESEHLLDYNESTEDEVYTTESSSERESISEESDKAESIVVTLASDQNPFDKESLTAQIAKMLDSLRDRKLHHLGSRRREDIKDELLHADILTLNIDDLYSSQVPARHCVSTTR